MASITYSSLETVTISLYFTETSYWVITTDLLASGHPMTLTEASLIRNTPVQTFTVTHTLVGPATTDVSGNLVLSTPTPSTTSSPSSSSPTSESITAPSSTSTPSASLSAATPTAAASNQAKSSSLPLPVILSLSIAIPLLAFLMSSVIWLILRYRRQKKTYKEAMLIAPRLSDDPRRDLEMSQTMSPGNSDSLGKRVSDLTSWSDSKRSSGTNAIDNTKDWQKLQVLPPGDGEYDRTRSDLFDYTSRGTSAWYAPSNYPRDSTNRYLRPQTLAYGTEPPMPPIQDDVLESIETSPEQEQQARWNEAIRRLNSLKDPTSEPSSSTLIDTRSSPTDYSPHQSRPLRMSMASSNMDPGPTASTQATRDWTLKVLEGRAKRATRGYSPSVYSRNIHGESICDPAHQDRQSAWFNFLKRLYGRDPNSIQHHRESGTTLLRPRDSNHIRGMEMYSSQDTKSFGVVNYGNYTPGPASTFGGGSRERMEGLPEEENELPPPPVPSKAPLESNGYDILSPDSYESVISPGGSGMVEAQTHETDKQITPISHNSIDFTLLRPDVYKPPEQRGRLRNRADDRAREERRRIDEVEQDEQAQRDSRDKGKQREVS